MKSHFHEYLDILFIALFKHEKPQHLTEIVFLFSQSFYQQNQYDDLFADFSVEPPRNYLKAPKKREVFMGWRREKGGLWRGVRKTPLRPVVFPKQY